MLQTPSPSSWPCLKRDTHHIWLPFVVTVSLTLPWTMVQQETWSVLLQLRCLEFTFSTGTSQPIRCRIRIPNMTDQPQKLQKHDRYQFPTGPTPPNQSNSLPRLQYTSRTLPNHSDSVHLDPDNYFPEDARELKNLWWFTTMMTILGCCRYRPSSASSA